MIILSSQHEPKIENPPVSVLVKNPIMLLAFGFGSGLSKYVPGTMGTLFAVPFYLLLAQLSLLDYALITIASFIIGVFICGYAAHSMGVHDHRGIVWDEYVGFWITMFAVPLTWYWVLIGFIYFRIFDMVKPWPISWVDEHVHGGFGIMIDDVIAGIVAALCLHATIYLTWGMF